MDFESQVQKDVHERVGLWMREIFGERASPLDDGPGYRARFGSASVECVPTSMCATDRSLRWRLIASLRA